MRFSALASGGLVLLLQACSFLDTHHTEAAQSGQRDENTPLSQGTKQQAETRYRLERELRTVAPASTTLAPDVVIKVNPDGNVLPADTQARLQTVAEQMKTDERLTIRLEGYAPDGGSPVWNMGAAEKSVRLIKDRLEAMRVPARRIQIASYGEEHEVERDKRWHWVEIYYIRPRK